MGGENFALGAGGLDASVSSTHGRGKLDALARVGTGDGLIPAWTGKTDNRGGRLSGFQAHPRAGGENRAILWAASLLAGSSPRGRGKLIFVGFDDLEERLIPTRAGKT